MTERAGITSENPPGGKMTERESLFSDVPQPSSVAMGYALYPPAKYRTIVADPPWHYDGFAGSVGRGGQFAGQTEKARVQVKPLPYPSMTLAEIEALPVSDLADKDAWLFCWTTNRYLHDAFHVIEAWGFRYAQTLVWHKTSNVPPFGGTFVENRAEYLLACRRGSPRVTSRWPSSVISAPKPNDLHSRKPDAFLDYIAASTEGPRIELFARRQRIGWHTWGNQSREDVEMTA